MKLAVVAGHVPSLHGGGATLTTWTIVQHALAQGHEVAVVPLVRAGYVDSLGTGYAERATVLEALGATVHPVISQAEEEWTGLDRSFPARLRRAVQSEPELLFPTLRDRPAMEETLSAIAPDAVIAYHWEPLAALYGVHVAPKIGLAVEPMHLPALYRWRARMRRAPSLDAVRALQTLQAMARLQPGLMVRFLNDCAASGNYSAHHAAWLRSRGARDCEYIGTPVPDPLGEGWRARRDEGHADKPRLLLIGRLRGLATMEGLGFLAYETIPRLEEALGPDGFEVRIVGADNPRPRVQEALDRPSVTLCGYQDDVADEFVRADALVVPTPIKLGTRVRIATAFSYACPVVAHEANGLGMPELVDRDNIMLGKTGSDLAEGIIALVRDRDLQRRLEERGRETFERRFSPAASVGRVLELAAQAVDAGRVGTAG
jgi:glycosyltransferase involved in cell wall biosynthesis